MIDFEMMEKTDTYWIEKEAINLPSFHFVYYNKRSSIPFNIEYFKSGAHC